MCSQTKILTLLAVLLAACSDNDRKQHSDTGPESFSVGALALADVRTGTIEPRMMSPVVAATGEIEVPPRGLASVSVPVAGYVAETRLVPGDFVKKGQLLTRLSSPDYIALQQSYLETVGELQFAQQELERQQTLQAHEATAAKRLQESASRYKVLTARRAGLQAQLELTGTDMVRLGNDEIQSTMVLRAPISGYVTAVNHHAGEFVGPQDVLFEIVNPTRLHMHLHVFERDIAAIRRGQTIRFRPVGKDEWYEGEVSLVSPKRNDVSQTYDVHAHIAGDQDGLKPGMYVDAEIRLSPDTVPALPKEAVVRFEGNTLIILDSAGVYRPQVVTTGLQSGDWVEIRNAGAVTGQRIVISGASRVFAALQRRNE